MLLVLASRVATPEVESGISPSEKDHLNPDNRMLLPEGEKADASSTTYFFFKK